MTTPKPIESLDELLEPLANGWRGWAYDQLDGIKTKIIIVEPVKRTIKVRSDKGKKRGNRNESK